MTETLKNNLFYWNIVDLQCGVNFCCMAKWFSYTYIYTHTHILFHVLFLYGLSQDIEYGSLCVTIGPCCLSIICKSLHRFIPNSIPSLPHLPLGNHRPVFCAFESVSFCRWVPFVIFYLFVLLSCAMWDLYCTWDIVPYAGIEPWPSALRVWKLPPPGKSFLFLYFFGHTVQHVGS